MCCCVYCTQVYYMHIYQASRLPSQLCDLLSVFVCKVHSLFVYLHNTYYIIDFSYFTLNLREHSIKLIITKLFCTLAISIYKVNTDSWKKVNYTCGVARVCCTYVCVGKYTISADLNVHM